MAFWSQECPLYFAALMYGVLSIGVAYAVQYLPVHVAQVSFLELRACVFSLFLVIPHEPCKGTKHASVLVQAASSLITAASSPLLGMFLMGLFFPWANKWVSRRDLPPPHRALWLVQESCVSGKGKLCAWRHKSSRAFWRRAGGSSSADQDVGLSDVRVLHVLSAPSTHAPLVLRGP